MQRIQIGIIRKMNFHSLKCPLSRKPLLVTVTVQRKLHTCADSNSTYSGYALWNMCDSARHRVFYPGQFRKKLRYIFSFSDN